jgi:hypothetical protein
VTFTLHGNNTDTNMKATTLTHQSIVFVGDGIATGWTARVRFPAVQDFSLLRVVQTGGLTQPSIQWVRGTLSAGVKRPGPEADLSPSASAEIKNTWIYISTPPSRSA